jgi:sarcosine oxidase, subunit beta
LSDTADVVVIGGGVQGASLAFHLASRGARVTVVERSTIGAGATGRSSGLVRVYYDLLAEARVAAVAIEWFRDWEARVGGDCGFTRAGFLWIEEGDATDRVRANVASHRELGVDSHVVDAAGIRELAPGLAIADDEVAAWEPESGYADPSMTAGSFMRAARDRGARLVHGAAVTAIPVEGGRVRGVGTSAGAIDAPVVVNAAGGWAGSVAALAGLDLPLTVWRHDTGYLGVPASVPRPIPVVIDIPNEMYFRPEGRELVLVGLEDDNQMGGDPDRETATAAVAFHDRAAERIVRRVPGLIDGTFRTSHSGQDGLTTTDQRPLLGPAGPDGFFLDCGHSGTGFKTSPAVGLGMAEWILDGAPRSVDLAPFAYTRVVEGRILEGEHGGAPVWR